MSKGIMMVISGFSGAGKGTLIKLLTKRFPQYALSISATTRAPRAGETDGVEYFFKTEEEFQHMIENDELIEYEGYVGHYYGTPKAYVEEMTEQGRDVILEIDIRGGLNIKKRNPDAILIFVVAPTIAEIERRIRGRGTETEEVISERLAQIKREIEGISEYDYLLVNDDIEECINRLNCIAAAERQRVDANREIIEKLKEEAFGGRK